MNKFTLILLLSFSAFAENTNKNLNLDKSSFSFIENSNQLGIIVDMRYNSENNFTLEKVDGYKANACYLHTKVMDKLKMVHQVLKSKGYGLYLFDCYRPQKGVNHFVRWSESEDQPKSKSTYYPNLEKTKLFNLGYIARKSGHSRGATVDLSIYNLKDPKKQPIDMGTPFDFFGPKTHTANQDITEQAKKNRMILKAAMESQGFENYRKEWWHYTFKPEPTPNTYFNFNVETDSK